MGQGEPSAARSPPLPLRCFLRFSSVVRLAGDVSHEGGLCLWRPSVSVWIDLGRPACSPEPGPPFLWTEAHGRFCANGV